MLMSMPTTWAPHAASCCAIALPIPRAAPVTTARRPDKSTVHRAGAGAGAQAAMGECVEGGFDVMLSKDLLQQHAKQRLHHDVVPSAATVAAVWHCTSHCGTDSGCSTTSATSCCQPVPKYQHCQHCVQHLGFLAMFKTDTNNSSKVVPPPGLTQRQATNWRCSRE